jgi:hypothetical protein
VRGLCAIVWCVESSDKKLNNEKYVVAFGGRQAMIFNTTTNQKQAATTEGTT